MVDTFVNIIFEDNKEFDYNFVRSKYFEACSNAYEKQSSINGPWTIKARECLIDCLKKGKIDVGGMYDFNNDVFTKYQIVLEDGVEKLVINGSATEVLPYEESFDVFVDAHMATAHGDFRATKAELESTFFVEDICLKYFILNCNVCHKRSMRKEPKLFNECVVIEIRKLPVADVDSKYILFYMDKGTTFKLFKPLISFDECELSIELFKIFTDFGPPLTIETPHVQILNKVLSTLDRAGLKYNIAINTANTFVNECTYLMEYILNKSDPRGSHWTTTSRFVQYSHNRNDIPVQVLRRGSPPLSPLLQLFAYQHDYKNEEMNTTIEKPSTIQETVKLESDDEETNETINIIDRNIDYNSTSEPGTSKTEDMTAKHEISIEETVITKPTNKNNKASTARKDRSTTKSKEISDTVKNEGIKNKFCSDCKGRMFSNFHCYGCRKPTHIFCLKRFPHEDIRENAEIVSFLYCRSCIK